MPLSRKSAENKNETLSAGQQQVLEMIARGAPWQTTLDTLLRVIEAQSSEMLCSILLLDPDGIHLRHGAAPSLPRVYMDAIDGYAIGAQAGSCGTAIFRREAVFVKDIAEDPLWVDYRELALSFNLHACWSTPIFDESAHVLGSFAIYYRTPGMPSKRHMELIEVATHLASIAISRRQAELERERLLAEAEAARRDAVSARDLLSSVFSRMNDGIVALDNDWRYVYVNQNAAALLNRSKPEDLVGKHIWTEYPEGESQEFGKAYRRAMETQQVVYYENYYPPWDRWFENRIYPSADGLTIYFTEITDRKRAERALRGERALLDQVTACSPLGIMAMDVQGQISLVNQAALDMLGADRAQVMQRNHKSPEWKIADLKGQSVPEEQWPFARVKTSGKPIVDAEYSVEKPNGQRVLLSVNAAPLRDESGEMAGVVFALSDIGERLQGLETLRASEQKFGVAFRSSPDAITITSVADGVIVDINEAGVRLTGYQREELVGRSTTSLNLWVSSLERDRYVAELGKRGSVTDLQAEFRKRDGEIRIGLVSGELIEIGGKSHILGVIRDITEHKLAGERQQLQAAALNSTRDAVMITDLDARIFSVNPAFTDITGYAEAEVLGRKADVLQSGMHDQAFFQSLWSSLLEQGQWQGELWNRRKNGDVYPQWLTINAVRNAEGASTHYVAVMTDLSVIRRSEEQLEHLTHYDSLTDLPNRVLLRSLLQHALEKAQRQGHQTGVLFLNLDKFKTINDSLGHVSADQVLLGVTSRLNERLGGKHILGRLGADEFVVVLEEVSGQAETEAIAFDLLLALEAPFLLDDGHEVYARTSIGISLYPQDGELAHDLLHHADAAVHKAKERGGNQIAFYTRELNAQALRQLELEAGMRRALLNREFILYYQPKVDLITGGITGAEALLRWMRPQHGMVSPLDFIPLAERNGQIVPIGILVFDEVCRQLRAWHDAGLKDVNVAVNVSARQFAEQDLETVIREALARHEVQAQWLTIELTESMLVENPDQTIERLRSLKRLGLQLSLDDFGTGYSSLAYLSRFPIDQLKIDRSFVTDIVTDQSAANIANSIIDLSHRMQLKVVAEGVETLEQMTYLRQNRCDEMQGYYFSKPVPAEEFARLLREGKTLAIVE